MASRLRGRNASARIEAIEDPHREDENDGISAAQLNLERVIEQNRQREQKNAPKAVEQQNPGPPTKGKPRLLLMGQRR